MPRLLHTIFTSLVLAASASAGVVINEIMARPGTVYPEDPRREFIELFNTDATPVDISGWAFTSGVNYTFPQGTTIAAGGFILVASDPAQAAVAYGRNDFLGPWVGELSNNAENIKLQKPGVVVGTMDKVDEVTYATEGDWATRIREATFGGWAWSSGATLGRTMELRNPLLSNDNGQNWAVSAALNGTPGAANSAFTTNVAPVIKAVKHSPAVPKSTDPVKISCELNDETIPAGLTASLFWRNATSTSPGAFQQVAMTGDGTGKFSAILPAMANLTIVEFYVSASDGSLTRTWPAPTSEGQNANCQYQVDNEVDTATDSYYRMVLTGAENAAYNTVSSSSDREFNQTLVTSRNGETQIRYRASMRIRGNSSRTYATAKPLRVSVPLDDQLDGVTDFNLHIKASFLQFLGMRVMQAAGLPGNDSLPVEVRRNGVEYTTSTGSTPDYGKWVRVETDNRDYVGNHWPTATGGNLYTKRSPERYWRSSGWTVPSTPDGTLDTWAKHNNSDANDWSDLTNFFAVFQAAAAPHFPGASATDVAQSTGGRLSGVGAWNSTALTAQEITSIETVADLDHWAKWFAVMTIMQDVETNISNGVDDDYGIFFLPDGNGNRRAQFAVHDMDTIFGLGDSQRVATNTGLYDMTEGGDSSFGFRTLLPLFGTAAVPGNAAFRQKYLNAIRSAYGTFLNADNTTNPNPPFYQFIDSHLSGWAPAATITSIKNFATARQAHLLGLIGAGAITPATATATSTLAATPGTIVINEVLANNVAAVANGTTFPDMIELRNGGSVAVDIGGFTITDDPAVPAKFTFPANTIINPGEFLVVFADSITTLAGIHAGFSLDQDGDQVQLRDDSGTLIDSVTFGPQVADLSISRTGAGLNTWALTAQSIGSANTSAVTLGSPAGLKINEWGTNPDYLLSGDFIELYNPAAQPVPIGGMQLTDDVTNYPARHTFPALSFVPASGFLRLNAKGGAASAGNPTELAFNLNSTFGYIAFSGANGTVVDRVDVIGQPRDISQGRSPNGSDTIVRFSLPSLPPTPGASNIAPPANVLNLLKFLRISEVLFRPNTLEFIEFQNTGTVALDLSGVQFTSGVSYTFPAGTTLAPGAFIVVCKDRAAFVAQYGAGIQLGGGNFTGSLDNAGETLSLQPPSPWNVNILSFSYDPGWFVDPTGDHSFTLVNAAGTIARDWSDKDSWQLSATSFGTPGNDGPPTITSVLTASADAGGAFTYQIVATKNPSAFDALNLPNGLTIDTATGIISGATSVSGNFNVTISATNSAGSDSKTLALSFPIPPAPIINSSLAISGAEQAPINYQITAQNRPTTFNATGLPAWLSVNTTTGVLTGTPPAIGDFQVTISAANFGGSDSKTLTISITDVGPFERFEWDIVPSQIANTPFTATLRAVDSVGRTVNYNGPVNVGAVGASEMGVVLTEFGCSTPTPDYFEIQNLSGSTVNTNGWFVMTSRFSVGVNSVNNTSWLLPASLAPGQVIGATDGTPSTGETLYGVDIDWAGVGPKGWVMLSDASGTIRDFCAWGYTAAELATISFTHRGFTFTLGAQWSGDGATIPLASESLFRSGNTDTNDATNWSIAATPFPRGAQNSGLFAATPLAMQPVNAVMAGGVWNGSLSVLDVSSAKLTAAAAGAPTAFSNTFALATPTLNTPPTFTKGADQTVPMDSGARSVPGWASAIRMGASNETAQTVSFQVAADNTALFLDQPAISAAGVLTFTPATHASGVATVTVTPIDSGGTAGGGVNTGLPQTFTITVSPNTAPSFVKGADISVGDTAGLVTRTGWATSISAGTGETGQSVSFTVTNSDNTLFSTQPAVTSGGTLTFAPAPDFEGTATVFVTAVDDGGTANGGVNTSAMQSFTITVIGVNHAPTFTAGPDISVRHNVGAQSIVGWATNLTTGSASESAQTLNFEVSTAQPELFSALPVLSRNGTLSFTPHPTKGGVATVTATLRDDGGTANGGVDFVSHQFTITIRAVNDAPSFTAGTSLSVGVGSSYSQTYATSIVAGPPDEVSQTVSFLVSNNHPELFTSAPSVLPNGQLSFAAGSATGTAVLTIRAKDNGGTADGGVDESAPATLTIRIQSALEAVGSYYGLLSPDVSITLPTEKHFGISKTTLAKNGAFSGALVLGGKKYSYKGTVTDTGVVKFSGNQNTMIIAGNLIFTLQIQLGENPAFVGVLKPSTANFARFFATRPLYNGKTALVPTTILDPLTDKGKYAAAFLALASPNNTFSANEFPQGDGTGALVVGKTGTVKLKGKLADGTSYSMASVILAGDTVPLYVPLYKGLGALVGTATARDIVGSDFDGAGFRWFGPKFVKPAAVGIRVDLIATKLLPKALPFFPSLGATDTDGNAAVDLSDAALGVKALNIDAKAKSTVVAPGLDKLKVSTSFAKGVWSGSFVSPATTKTVKFSGVILRKAGYGTGYYIDGTSTGRVQISPTP